MFQTHHQRILQALATSLGIWSLLVWVDVATGLHVRFGPFYALPVILCSWFLGRPWGIMAAMLSAGLWHGIQSQALPPSGPFFDRFLDLAMGFEPAPWLKPCPPLLMFRYWDEVFCQPGLALGQEV